MQEWCRKCGLTEIEYDGGLIENRGIKMVEKLTKCKKCGTVIRKEREHYEERGAYIGKAGIAEGFDSDSPKGAEYLINSKIREGVKDGKEANEEAKAGILRRKRGRPKGVWVRKT